MKSAEDLRSRIGGNMRESMGAHRPTATVVPGVAQPAFHGETAKYRGAARIKDALAIDLDRLMPDPDQPRKEFDPQTITDLSDSLKARGQLQPIRVRFVVAADRWVIVAGERRYRAAVQAGLASLMCIEAKGDPDPDDILEDQLVENCLREDLKPIEQARAFRALLDRRGWSYRQLSDHLHVAPASVARALALLDLPDDLQGRVESGQLAPSVAYEVSRIVDRDAQREVAERVVSEGLSRAEAVEEVRRAEDRSTVKRTGAGKGKGAKSRKVTERAFKTEGGTRVTLENRRGLDGPAIITALEQALMAARGEFGDDQVAA